MKKALNLVMILAALLVLQSCYDPQYFLNHCSVDGNGHVTCK